MVKEGFIPLLGFTMRSRDLHSLPVGTPLRGDKRYGHHLATPSFHRYNTPLIHQRSKTVLEVNPIELKIKELSERLEILRRYL